MKFFRKLTLALLTLGVLSAAAFALPLTTGELAQMVQESPSLDDYRDSPAVIWSRKLLYTQDTQKREVKTSQYVILCDPTARLEWLTDQMVAPAGGRIELEQAAIFDPGSSRFTHQIPCLSEELKNGRIVLNMPKPDDVYVFVLSFRQTFAEPDVMEDVAHIAVEFPIWEGSVQVRIARDQELKWESSTDTNPTTAVDNNFRRYGWFYFKQPATRGVRGIVESSDPYLVFSNQTGPATAVAAMNDLQNRTWASLPEQYVEQTGSERERALKSIAAFWRSPLRLPGTGTWRSADMIPANGPWTSYESVYLVAQWLQKRGWKAEVWFQHIIPQDRESLSCAPGIEHPVLYLVEPGGKKGFYYVPGTVYDAGDGKIPVSLRGKTIYSPGTRRLHRRSLSGSKMEKNRLSMDWNLKIGADNIVSGTLDLRVRNSWAELFESLSDGRKEDLSVVLAGLEGWIDSEQELKVSALGSTGFRLVIPVRARSAIEDARGVMIGIPSVTPAPLLRLLDVESSAVLRFPFVVEQSYNISLPSGYRLLAVPLKAEQGSMVSSYTSQYHHNRRRNVIDGEEKMIQNVTRVDATELPGFKRVLDVWGTWRNTSLALISTKR